MQSSSATLLLLGAIAVRAADPAVLRTLAVDANGQIPPVEADAELLVELQRDVDDHDVESASSCLRFFCGPARPFEPPPLASYSMGPVPSNDLPAAFEGERQIHVTQAPIFSAEECDWVIATAEEEGEGLPSSKSGKYQIGKAWIQDMPSVLAWFNRALEAKLFPMLARLFPKVVSDSSLLRAHSVAILKYNESHPQTDVHVDDALLAFTVALSPSHAFQGGGTYFEHIDQVIDMEQGQATFRPGSVRHAGSTVTGGLRYVIGGFIAVADQVEHVRRLNERGNRLLLDPAVDEHGLRRAARLFNWSLALNPSCSLCHQNAADALLRLGEPERAEHALRAQLQLLPRDSDAHFALGVALRAQSRHDEAAAAYEAALAIQPRDFEAWVNLAAVRGALSQVEAETNAYQRAVALRPAETVAWLNLGISYTAADKLAEAEEAFRHAQAISPDDPRPSLSLGRHLLKLARPAEAISSFYTAAMLNSEYFDEVKVGVATAKAQQGRLAEATESFESASRMSPKNTKLAESLEQMRAGAARLAEAAAGFKNAVDEVCGTPCQDIADASGTAVCGVAWRDGCGEAPPPEGFSDASLVAELCKRSCAVHILNEERAT
ncbi:hypothetical protein AB1Y20_006993 [Prymnesium parvum]|uniref:Prolyl 4-hydroxylase alpha subunit domain-containing protein n=1 Tax=Prymnesium parvum TaxID=97485 RepID=A0AB34J1Y3_PRYPA